ncbi:MAG: hypothetical protein DWI69_00355 [Chloroflexi bacterium]|nr:MAG: hypothetical protein DWI69_00355 [Chloroflexota bacterium]
MPAATADFTAHPGTAPADTVQMQIAFEPREAMGWAKKLPAIRGDGVGQAKRLAIRGDQLGWTSGD